MRTHRILAILAVLALVLAGCAGGSSASDVGLVFDIGGRGDQSFNDSAAAGLDQAVDELDISSSEASANDDGSNREELLQLQAEENSLVFGIGFLFDVPMQAAAEANPDVNFAIVDGFVDPAEYPNVASLLFAEEQGSFLVGAAAALKSGTGTIGFIGGVNTELIQRFEAGYVAGAQAVNPSITVISQYVTEPPNFDGFNDPASGKVIAQSMYEQGADIVYHAAGGTGAGLFQAAKEYSDANGSKVWAIGVDSDQYLTAGDDVKEHILTSMLKRVDVSVFNTIEAHVNDEFSGGSVIFDLSVDGVGYSTSGGYVDDIADQLEDYKQQIIDGDIVVPTSP
ncbi:MAG: BMP family ABC transporter substrate-binding protein [Acidimicrobiia bacterium]|nr:BMP family ABC transporter substrate-binding protein [Acidimicrobiia bacterium]